MIKRINAKKTFIDTKVKLIGTVAPTILKNINNQKVILDNNVNHILLLSEDAKSLSFGMKQNYNKKTTTSVSFKSFVPLTRSVIGKNSTNVQLDYSLVGISVQPLMCRDKLCKLIFRDTNSSNIARIFDIYHLIEISSNKQIIKDQSVDVDLVVELNYKTIIINKSSII
mmetsp:Transcript_25660/g.61826  ORF Transcript_25660/g.61826 Transcript_25660/m.61826 type:complete len:169 (+) Transcript_25660:1074-1580(+)